MVLTRWNVVELCRPTRLLRSARPRPSRLRATSSRIEKARAIDWTPPPARSGASAPSSARSTLSTTFLPAGPVSPGRDGAAFFSLAGVLKRLPPAERAMVFSVLQCRRPFSKVGGGDDVVPHRQRPRFVGLVPGGAIAGVDDLDRQDDLARHA